MPGIRALGGKIAWRVFAYSWSGLGLDASTARPISGVSAQKTQTGANPAACSTSGAVMPPSVMPLHIATPSRPISWPRRSCGTIRESQVRPA